MHASVFYFNSCIVERHAIVKLEAFMQLSILTYVEPFVGNKHLCFFLSLHRTFLRHC